MDAQHGMSVGSFNVLHPPYAVKYADREGINARGQSNWVERLPAIAAVLLAHDLDVYLLQEVGPAEMDDLRAHLGASYAVVYARHPARGSQRADGSWTGGDGVALLLRAERVDNIEPAEPAHHCGWAWVPESPYMATAIAHVLHKPSGARVLLASVHLYDKKAHQPQRTLLAHLAARAEQLRPDAVVWGGDCNRLYGPFEVPGFACAPAVRATRPRSRKAIDWIFARSASAPLAPVRTEATEAFVRATLEPRMLSDHCAEAVVVAITRET